MINTPSFWHLKNGSRTGLSKKTDPAGGDTGEERQGHKMTPRQIFQQWAPRVLTTCAGRIFSVFVLLSLVMGGFGLRLDLDGAGVSFSSGNLAGSAASQTFLKHFGTDDYILLAVAHDRPLNDPDLRTGLRQVRALLSASEGVRRVVDLDRVTRIPGMFDGDWSAEGLASLHGILPGLDRLVSRDGQVLGILIRVDNEAMNGFRLERLVRRAKQVILDTIPGATGVYAAGIPVLRAAFERHNLVSAAIFSALGMGFAVLVALVLFRTIWAALLVLVSALASLVWLTGVMGLAGIKLNMASGLGFGFVLIVSCTTVFHILSDFLKHLNTGSEHRNSALEKTYARVTLPCFMCALTTAAGFLSLGLSPVPMVAQAGVVISTGVMLAFALALPVTAFVMPRTIRKPRAAGTKPRAAETDFLDRAARMLKIPGTRHVRSTLVLALGFSLVMAAGIPRLGMVKHLSQPMVNRTQTAKDMAFVRDHLSTGYSFSMVFRPKSGQAPSRRFWYDLIRLEKRIKAMDGVAGLDSIAPYIFHTALKASPAGIQPERVYAALVHSAKDLVSAFVDPDTHAVRIEIHIHDRSSDQIETLLAGTETLAREILGNRADIGLTGQLIFLRAETTALVRAQARAMAGTLAVITLFMLVQLRSISLGLLSLVPNVLPVITIFGIMGWAGIALDPLTIFAAVISLGLSVDDSIHFLTAFRRHTSPSDPEAAGWGKTDTGLDMAYADTARALIATTAVLFFAATGLVFSPFAHVASLGILVASAALAALAGDLMVLPALLRFLEQRRSHNRADTPPL
jgi:predicted RND superfamily exporter protein